MRKSIIAPSSTAMVADRRSIGEGVSGPSARRALGVVRTLTAPACKGATLAAMAAPGSDPIWTDDALADLRRDLGEAYAGRTAVVTGADGFMGSHLTEALV